MITFKDLFFKNYVHSRLWLISSIANHWDLRPPRKRWRKRRNFESYFKVGKYFKYEKLKVLDYEIKKWVVVIAFFSLHVWFIHDFSNSMHFLILFFSVELKIEASWPTQLKPIWSSNKVKSLMAGPCVLFLLCNGFFHLFP